MTESNGIKIRVSGLNKRFGDKDVLNDVISRLRQTRRPC